MITLTPDQVRDLATGYLQTLYPTRAVTPHSYLGHRAEALAQMVDLLQQEVIDVQKDSIPAYDAQDGVLKSRCSTEALDEWAYTFALPSNRGVGKYGRNAAQASRGGGGFVVGAPGTLVPTGALLTDPTGRIVVQLVSGVTVGVGGSTAGAFAAVTVGAASNLPLGTKLTWTSPPPGLASTVVLTAALTDGYDIEGDLALLLRLLRQLQSPISGGTASDFRQWAESATDASGGTLGITRAYVFPKRNGLGSVDVVPTVGGTGIGRDPGSVKAALLQTFLDGKRVACDTVRVVRPWFPDWRKLAVILKVTPAPGYGFDFAASVAFGALDVLAGSTATVVKFTSTALTTALRAAVTAGRQPRIQFPGLAGAIPVQRRAISAVDAAGVTTVTLDSTLGAVPATGSYAYPGGGAVLPVALAVNEWIDSLGPSNQSGTADRVTDDWQDAVYISAVGRAALDAVDEGGVLVLETLPKIGTGVGVTIAVGASPASAVDAPLYDNVPGLGPQFAEAASIAVLVAT